MRCAPESHCARSFTCTGDPGRSIVRGHALDTNMSRALHATALLPCSQPEPPPPPASHHKPFSSLFPHTHRWRIRQRLLRGTAALVQRQKPHSPRHSSAPTTSLMPPIRSSSSAALRPALPLPSRRAPLRCRPLLRSRPALVSFAKAVSKVGWMSSRETMFPRRPSLRSGQDHNRR